MTAAGGGGADHATGAAGDHPHLHPHPHPLFRTGGRPALVGVLHVPPLPGSPRWRLPLAEIIAWVERDAHAYAAGGVDALLLENYGDAPFARGPVEPHVIALLTAIGAHVRASSARLPLGVNVLRNDGRGALAVALAVGAAFVRVNVLLGVVATDQGLIEGPAASLLRERARLAPAVAVVADVDVKHGRPLWGESLAGRARELHLRGGAHALVVTGEATGVAAARSDVATVLAACPGVPVVVGSGVNAGNAGELLPGTQGAIVGTAAKRGGVTAAPVEAARVREIVAAARAAWGGE